MEPSLFLNVRSGVPLIFTFAVTLFFYTPKINFGEKKRKFSLKLFVNIVLVFTSYSFIV